MPDFPPKALLEELEDLFRIQLDRIRMPIFGTPHALGTKKPTLDEIENIPIFEDAEE